MNNYTFGLFRRALRGASTFIGKYITRPASTGVVNTSALASMIFVSCSSTYFVNMQSLKSKLGLKEFPGGRQYPNADAIILSNVHDVEATVTGDGNVETNEIVTRIVKLLRDVNDHASVHLTIYNGEKLYDISARTIEPDGRTIVLKSGDFHTVRGGGSGYIFYSDQKEIRFTFPAVQRNCIIEYHYVMHQDNPFIQDIWQIQSMYPELENTYKLTLPILLLLPETSGGYGWNWRYRAYNCTVGKPVYKERLDRNEAASQQTVSLTWTRKNIPAFEPDPMMPSYDDYLQFVKFAPSAWKKWDDISEWYYGRLFQPQIDITPAISAKARELTKGCISQTQKIRKVFDFVQSLRYVAIELGLGGYVPSRPATVLTRMYGDCKDKSILLISLFRSLGINAKPVLVLTSDEGVVDPSFPCWMFNHMIVKATEKNGKAYWLDATADHCGLGEIPYQDQGTNALVLNYNNTSQIETIPSSTFSENAEIISAMVSIAPSGTAKFGISVGFKGQANLEARENLSGRSRKDMIRFCRSTVADNFLDSKVVNYSTDNMDNFDTTLELNYKLIVPNAIESQDGMLMLDIDPFKIAGGWSWLARNHRKYPIDFNFPRIITKAIYVTLPDEYTIRKLPTSIDAHAGGLFFTKRYLEVAGNKFILRETFAITTRLVASRDFRAVKKLAERIRDASNELILLSEARK